MIINPTSVNDQSSISFNYSHHNPQPPIPRGTWTNSSSQASSSYVRPTSYSPRNLPFPQARNPTYSQPFRPSTQPRYQNNNDQFMHRTNSYRGNTHLSSPYHYNNRPIRYNVSSNVAPQTNTHLNSLIDQPLESSSEPKSDSHF